MSNWMIGTEAIAWAKYLGTEYGPGFVLFEECGVFCIDIDKALVNGEWSPLAKQMCEKFSGAYIEVSQSGKALHIFGSYTGTMPPHRKKHVPLHMEFYTGARFIGMTGTNAVGDETHDCTAMLPELIAQYFVPGQEVDSNGWTTSPAPEWVGPADDETLIKIMLASRGGAGAMLGHKAHVVDLWHRNVDKLAAIFPPQTEGKDFDYSSADQAFFNHLSFWTGGNCERMLDIANRSLLRRDKWNREDYLRGTIIKASSGARSFYKGGSNEPSPSVADSASVEPGPVQGVAVPPTPEQFAASAGPASAGPASAGPASAGPASAGPASAGPASAGTALNSERPPLLAVTVGGVPLPPNEPPKPAPPETGHGRILAQDGQTELFSGCLYVSDVNQIMVPSGVTLKREQFDNHESYCGRKFIVDTQGTLDPSAWSTFTQSMLVLFPRVRSTFFDPRMPEGHIKQREDGFVVNTWRDPKIVATPGDVSLYTTHIKKLFPNGDDALIYTSYVAACIQNLGVKAAWALLVQGVPGNGKSFLTKVMQYCLGESYVHSAAAANLDNHFNGYLYRKLMILVEEIKTIEGNAATWEKLKTMITEPRQEIEQKGVDQITREVCFNMVFNSNHKDGIRKTKEDRRICPLFAAQQTTADLERDGMDEQYFIRLFDWFEAGGKENILHYLRTFDIPAKYNFAKEARRAPKTTSTDEAIAAGLGSVEQDILEAIKSGKAGFKGGWISSDALNIMLSQTPRGKFMNPSTRAKALETLGYIKHPGLTDDGRLTTALADGTRPRLWVRDDHTSLGVTEGRLLMNLYVQAQK
jgi:hypothetical protein